MGNLLLKKRHDEAMCGHLTLLEPGPGDERELTSIGNIRVAERLARGRAKRASRPASKPCSGSPDGRCEKVAKASETSSLAARSP
jgi:hypothetical protein